MRAASLWPQTPCTYEPFLTAGTHRHRLAAGWSGVWLLLKPTDSKPKLDEGKRRLNGATSLQSEAAAGTTKPLADSPEARAGEAGGEPHSLLLPAGVSAGGARTSTRLGACVGAMLFTVAGRQ